MVPGEKTQYHNPGQADWIYWLDLVKWNNALVIQNKKEQAYNQVELHFDNVHFAIVTSVVEFEMVLDDLALNKTEFDLIVCTDLLSQFSGHPEIIKKLLNRLALVLSADGRIVFC
jgi:chemotaxis methyl-accepting protein methylase